MRVLISISAGGSFARYVKRSPCLSSVVEIVADRERTRIDAADVDHRIVRRGDPNYFERFLELAGGYDLVVLNSNWILPPEVVRPMRGRLINMHPALLPAFRGLHVADDILRSGVCVSGSTFHFVAEDVDAGPIIAQSLFAVHPDDTVEELGRRNWAASRDLFVQVVRWFEEGRVEVDWERGAARVQGASYALGPSIPNLELAEAAPG